MYDKQKIQDQRIETAQKLSQLKSQLEIELNSVIYLAYGLTTFIAVTPESSATEWNQMSAELIRNGRHIRNIGLAPNLELTFLYPLKGNEKALGLKYREDPLQWPAVKKAITSQTTYIAGPLELLQGGVALIARTPIYLDAPDNTKLWGLSSIVISFSSLLDAIEIDKLKNEYRISIRGKDGLGENGKIFYGDDKDYTAASLRETIRFPSGSWVISAVPKNPPYQNFIVGNAVRIAGFLLGILFFATFYSLFKRYKISHDESMQDPLTGLANRRLLIDRFSQNIHFHRRKKLGFGIISIDLDKFKPINDNFGHDVGDEILIQVSRRLEQAVRASDTIARIGGDEFILLVPELTNRNDLNQLIVKTKEKLCGLPYQIKSHCIYLKMSFGYSIYPDDGLEIEELMHKSDKKMYQDKYSKQ